jgi:hypothetical protein
MLRHRDFQRSQLADLDVGNTWRDGAVDDAGRDMPQQIDDAGVRALVARRDQLIERTLDLGPYALERADGREQGS